MVRRPCRYAPARRLQATARRTGQVILRKHASKHDGPGASATCPSCLDALLILLVLAAHVSLSHWPLISEKRVSTIPARLRIVSGSPIAAERFTYLSLKGKDHELFSQTDAAPPSPSNIAPRSDAFLAACPAGCCDAFLAAGFAGRGLAFCAGRTSLDCAAGESAAAQVRSPAGISTRQSSTRRGRSALPETP